MSNQDDQAWLPLDEDADDDLDALFDDDEPDEEDLLAGLDALWLDELDGRPDPRVQIVMFDPSIMYGDIWIPQVLDEMLTGLLLDPEDDWFDDLTGIDEA